MSGDGEVSEETSPTDDELLEAAAGGEQGFEVPDATGEIDVAELVAERDEFRDTMLRVKAEFDNHRKRVARDQEELRESGRETARSSRCVRGRDRTRINRCRTDRKDARGFARKRRPGATDTSQRAV